ncbi:MAG: hypothetical protein AB8B63_24525 [Granulosicoccus sp.]
MNLLRQGTVTAGLIGIFWALIVVTSVAVAMSFATGKGFKPELSGCLLLGLVAGQLCLLLRNKWLAVLVITLLGTALTLSPLPPLGMSENVGTQLALSAAILTGFCIAWPLTRMLANLSVGALTRHSFEEAVIRFLLGFGYVFFTAIVLIPFYVMVMTSLK